MRRRATVWLVLTYGWLWGTAASGQTPGVSAPEFKPFVAEPGGFVHAAVAPRGLRPLSTPARQGAGLRTHGRAGGALWLTSLVTLAAANALDAQSSWGRSEANTMLASQGGCFAARGAAIKAGVNAAWMVSQVLILHKGGPRKIFAAANFALSGLFAASAAHNYAIPGARN